MLASTSHPDPSFEVSVDVVDARLRARRLAAPDLPIVIEGEPGTGRRTLAASVVQQRSEQLGRPVVAFDGIQGIPAEFTARFQSETVSLESLSARGLAELAALVHAKLIRLVAVVVGAPLRARSRTCCLCAERIAPTPLARKSDRA